MVWVLFIIALPREELWGLEGCVSGRLQGGRNFPKLVRYQWSSTKAWWLKSDEPHAEPCREQGFSPSAGVGTRPASTTIQILGPNHKVRAWSHITDHLLTSCQMLSLL